MLVVGCDGTGVEATKNLILCNVGAVVLWDPHVCARTDRGVNFYVTEGGVEEGTSRAAASVGELRSLNLYCRVVVLANVVSGVLGGGRGDVEPGRAGDAAAVRRRGGDNTAAPGRPVRPQRGRAPTASPSSWPRRPG